MAVTFCKSIALFFEISHNSNKRVRFHLLYKTLALYS